jgi:hypothetical protein
MRLQLLLELSDNYTGCIPEHLLSLDAVKGCRHLICWDGQETTLDFGFLCVFLFQFYHNELWQGLV